MSLTTGGPREYFSIYPKMSIPLMTYISAHAVLLFHFAFLRVQTVVRGAAVLFTGCA